MKTKESRTQQAELVNVILVLNVLCLCLTLPALSAQIVNTTLSPTEHDQKMLQRIEYITQVVDILAYWNHVIVWFVCIIFSGSFRNETKIMFGRLKVRCYSIRRGSHSEMKVIASGSSIQCQQEEESANTLV
ncbi:hypothetical protein FSP39_021706 [Pinctada imbricata]|uniref:Uncharacterized protein n=1 Tax=Pinctada imbricata TaxID=66713 RepID=A0AA88YS94_PINIB|nr:hypothetical protein FSP39_021706 [Pinctada imbricata]